MKTLKDGNDRYINSHGVNAFYNFIKKKIWYHNVHKNVQSFFFIFFLVQDSKI